MNLLTNYTLINDTFDSLSETVLINGEPQKAIIATAYLGMVENRHISSLQPFRRGDYVEHRGHLYIVNEEVKTPRHNKYRATMTSCNVSIEVRDFLGRVIDRFDELGRPIYVDAYSDPYLIHGVMKQWERSLNDAFALQMMEIAFFVDVRDTPEAREQFKINNVYTIKGMAVSVVMHDLSQNGLLGLLFIKSGKTPPY
ncbi:hypothetical protein [Planomicrobium sp. YIM 101495]|uniref:hypothetical protein n=1 Tax=Planomicrobium sp. YIM 101495 TaxID=2665160 RepID=UPI0012B7BFDF|nr:hypothetical protein [Planomicrobium sp. YIM 101495]MTD30111.1 hypothetical protein [Planomicrobium sp. YIM 101495]